MKIAIAGQGRWEVCLARLATQRNEMSKDLIDDAHLTS